MNAIPYKANAERYKSIDDCIPDGKDFQNWVQKTHLKIHPELVTKLKLNITCFVCDRIYSKLNSYCILGDNDMYYCSKFCFMNC